MKKCRQNTKSWRSSSEYSVWNRLYHKEWDVVCDRWKYWEWGEHPFDCFIYDMGRRSTTRQKLISRTWKYNKQDCFWLSEEDRLIISELHHKFWLIKQRCNNPSSGNYKYYWARGVKTQRLAVDTFVNDTIDIYKDSIKMYPWKKLLTDRIDNTLGYVKWNIRFVPIWISNANKTNNVFYWEEKIYIPELVQKTGVWYHKIQYSLLNGKDIYDEWRKDNHLLEYNWKKQPISVWAKELWLWWSTIYNRIQKWRPIEEVLSRQKIWGSKKMKIYQKV